MTECKQTPFHFHTGSRRQGLAAFNGGTISSDGGVLLLGQVERVTGILHQFAGCFVDHRDPERIEHPLADLVAQRVYALCLGYEDLHDHDTLRRDPLLATVVGKADPLGQQRLRRRDRGQALAGKSTLNRLELTPADADEESRYQKIVLKKRAVEDLLVDLFLQAHPRPPRGPLILDLDATDDPLHGQQQGRFFHGYYREYCYLPLYIFCGEHLLCARLRPACLDASAGALKQVQRIIQRIRAAWPQVRILVRGDGGFCREALMAWCEQETVDYVFGLPKNARLLRALGGELHQAQETYAATGRAARGFADLTYRTRKSWSRARRVVGKAEHLEKGPNPRFVVTSLPAAAWDARALYEDLYCARGEMENRIKEQQLGLFADRTSAATMRANQLRLWFSSLAYVLMHALRRRGLAGTELEKAQAGTIRLKLLKIGALVRISCRRVVVALSQSYPLQDLFTRLWRRLAQAPAWPPPGPAPG